MKSWWLPLATTIALLAGIMAAQTMTTPRLTADVPFEFVVNGKVLPAGTYLVSTQSSAHLVILENKDNREFSATVTNIDVYPGDPEVWREEGKLIFAPSNGQRVLHQISLPGDNHIHDLSHGEDVVELKTR